MTRDHCLQRDALDALAPMRREFALDDSDARGVIYLDGNSLGALPRRTMARVTEVVEAEWGRGLIGSWNTAGWITRAARVGDKIARLVGADRGELIVADSTSINLYKVLSTAVSMAMHDSPGRRRIVSERDNFPSDLYIADTLARERGCELVLADAKELTRAFDESVAVVMLTHVNYRTGEMHEMGATSRAAHDAGILTVWDLSHSAGAVPVSLKSSAADFAVGCGYKYLNGGPGAPAFVWVHPRHTSRMDREEWRQPLAGWLGHAAPFEFVREYRPAPGIARFTCGTPPIVALAMLECGVDVLLETEASGGMAALRAKAIALSELFIQLVEERSSNHLTLVSPREPGARGSQVCFSHRAGGYEIVQALIARGVVGDFRAPDILRFGFTPLYTRFVDVWDAAERLHTVLQTEEWRAPRFQTRAAVT